MRDALYRERPYPVPGGNGWESQAVPRCGMGGLYFNAPTCDYFLEAYDCVVDDEMALQMFKDLNMDAREEFAYDMIALSSLTGQTVESMDPLRKWPKRTRKKVRDFIEQNNNELLGDEFVASLMSD